MSVPVNVKGFARLDFDEIKKIAAMTGFDIRTYANANKRRSCACGPGSDYLMQDKRFYTLTLIKHLDGMLQAQPQPQDIPQEALDWLDRARVAAREYEAIERKLHQQLAQKKAP